MTNAGRRLSLAVLISGGGSNLQALIDAIDGDRLDAEIVVVISNNADAFGLQRARKAGLATEILDHRGFDARERYDAELTEILASYDPDLILLAGFMRILGAAIVRRFEGRMLNIHPSLLPRFRGLDTHRRAIEAGEKQHGCTVHYVTATLDGGPPIMQGSVDVLETDTPDDLAKRVLAVEHRIYPAAVAMIAEGRLQYRDEQVLLDGRLLQSPVIDSVR